MNKRKITTGLQEGEGEGTGKACWTYLMSLEPSPSLAGKKGICDSSLGRAVYFNSLSHGPLPLFHHDINQKRIGRAASSWILFFKFGNLLLAKNLAQNLAYG